MKAKVKINKLPDAPKPTKAVRVDVSPRNACFAETLERVKHKKEEHSWSTQFKHRTTQKWTEEETEEVIRMYEAGATITQIADHFSTTYDAVQSRLKKLQAAGRCGTHNPRRKEKNNDSNN